MTMRSSRHNLGALTALLVTLCASAAAAAEPTAAEREEAKRAYSAAKKLAAGGQRAEAIVLFRRAHELAPTPVTRLDLARALADDGKLVEAQELAASVAGMPASKTETSKSKLAREEAATLAPKLAARIPRLTLVVEPSGTAPEVALDGRPLSQELLSGALPLDPGEHAVVAKALGQTLEHKVTLVEAEQRSLALTFKAASPPPEPEPPTQLPAPLPPPARPPPAGPPVEPAAPVEHGVTPVVPVAFITAGVALLTGAITGGVALSQVGDLEEGCPNGFCPPDQHDLLSTHEALTTTSTVAFSVAGVAAAVGAVAWIVDATTSSGPKKASLGVQWTGTGVALTGTLP